ncbi:PRP38-domain-containing protein [Bimuria novae-zelandiae CBS 107.79]|uniref:Pre-mRNA-splicing factor 38 n=1 Tax=Bimuria novae-zelandiae CBS 107.79 TaxID=1447943 RepID=A0A6A5V572_9PLEO|nr:PRP38-domain-containing protein [Bimuria novae-zelandiae CBS 107.79]
MATVKADSGNLFDDRGYSGSVTVRGQNPALVLEKGTRERVVESIYWKESCFGLNLATLCDRAAALNAVGGTYGVSGKPTPFICLALKLLALAGDKEKDIILEMLNYRDEEDDEEEEEKENGETHEEERNGHVKDITKLNPFKYLRVLAAFHIRLTWEPAQVYKTLEPLLLDYRKVRRRKKDGFTLTTIDSLVSTMLGMDENSDKAPRLFGTVLPALPPRSLLEDLDLLEPRESPLQDEVDAMVDTMDEDDVRSRGSRHSSRSRSRSWSDGRDSRSRSRERSYTRSRSRSRSRSPRRREDSRDRYTRSRSRSEDYRRRSRSVNSRDGR